MYSFRFVTNATKVSNQQISQDWNKIIEEEEELDLVNANDEEVIAEIESVEPEKLSRLCEKFNVNLHEPEVLDSDDVMPFFNLTDVSNFAFASLVIRYNGLNKVEDIKQSEACYIINMEDIFEFDVRFRNDIFNRTCLPLGLVVNMELQSLERFKDSCRVLNCVFSGASLSSFERRIIPSGEGNLESINIFLNDNSWIGKRCLKWSNYLKDKLSQSESGTLGQWIYYKLYLRFVKDINEGKNTRDCSLRVLIAFACSLRKCAEADLERIVGMFDDFLSNDACPDCALKGLGYYKFPYAWNECDSFSFLVGSLNLNDSVFLNYGFECHLTENRLTRLGSKMGIRYFGDHSVMYSSFTGSKTNVISKNPADRFGALSIRISDWHSIAMALEIVVSAFKFEEKRKKSIGIRVYMEENRLTCFTNYNDIFDIFIPLVRRLSREDKPCESFYSLICFILMTGRITVGLWLEYEKFRALRFSIHKSVVFALKNFNPGFNEKKLLSEVMGMTFDRENWKNFMEEIHSIEIPFKVYKDMVFEWVECLVNVKKDMSIACGDLNLLELYDASIIHSMERPANYKDPLLGRILRNNMLDVEDKSSPKDCDDNKKEERKFKSKKPFAYKTNVGGGVRYRSLPHTSRYLKKP